MKLHNIIPSIPLSHFILHLKRFLHTTPEASGLPLTGPIPVKGENLVYDAEVGDFLRILLTWMDKVDLSRTVGVV